jgi:thiol-disulfide isomerase/thioredoxin
MRLWIIALLWVGTFAPPSAVAGDVAVHVFWRDGCPHCERELAFLRQLERERPEVRVQAYDVGRSAEARALFYETGTLLLAETGSVPLAVVGDQVFSGYLNDATTGAALRARALECAARGCPDSIAALRAPGAPSVPPVARASRAVTVPEVLVLPMLGELRLRELSLPALTAVLAALDGFNPCAMWTLVFLLGLLVGMRDGRRRWLLGGTFLVASAAVYLLFLTAWLNLFLFIGMVPWVRFVIGAVALLAAGHYLRQWVLKRDLVCEVTSPARRQRVFAQLRALVNRRQLTLALGGIVLLAFAVNFVELLCSAGIPAVFTHLLALNPLGAGEYAFYLALYLAVFLLDDLIVFVVAMKTLEISGRDTRYARVARLLGALVLAALGLLLLLRPQWLAMG